MVVSSNNIDVKENLTVTIYGERNGLATLHVIDQSMIDLFEVFSVNEEIKSRT